MIFAQKSNKFVLLAEWYVKKGKSFASFPFVNWTLSIYYCNNVTFLLLFFVYAKCKKGILFSINSKKNNTSMIFEMLLYVDLGMNNNLIESKQ